MARIRYIKPDFFLDEHLAELPFKARLGFAGLWCHADRSGRLEDSPKKLKAQIFPYDGVNMDAILDSLCQKPFIKRYEINSKRYIQILNFSEHQKPHHTEKKSEIPEYNGHLTVKEPGEKGRNGNGDGKGNGDGEKREPSASPLPKSPFLVDLKAVVVCELDEAAKHKLYNQVVRVFRVRGWDVEKLPLKAFQTVAESVTKAAPRETFPYFMKALEKHCNENAEVYAAQSRIENKKPKVADSIGQIMAGIGK